MKGAKRVGHTLWGLRQRCVGEFFGPADGPHAGVAGVDEEFQGLRRSVESRLLGANRTVVSLGNRKTAVVSAPVCSQDGIFIRAPFL